MAKLVSVSSKWMFSGSPVSRHACGEVIGGIEQPCVAGVGREQHQGTDGYKASVMFGGTALDVVNLFDEAKILALQSGFACSPFDSSLTHVSVPSV
jgi:hypothetical protein